jgi:hypothetical protein
MSNDLEDLSFAKHVARILIALAATVLVAAFSYVAISWVFGR